MTSILFRFIVVFMILGPFCNCTHVNFYLNQVDQRGNDDHEYAAGGHIFQPQDQSQIGCVMVNCNERSSPIYITLVCCGGPGQLKVGGNPPVEISGQVIEPGPMMKLNSWIPPEYYPDYPVEEPGPVGPVVDILKKVVEPGPVEEPGPMVEPFQPVAEPGPVEEPGPIVEPEPVEEPGPIVEPFQPVVEPEPVEKHGPMVEPFQPVVQPEPVEEPGPVQQPGTEPERLPPVFPPPLETQPTLPPVPPTTEVTNHSRDIVGPEETGDGNACSNVQCDQTITITMNRASQQLHYTCCKHKATLKELKTNA